MSNLEWFFIIYDSFFILEFSTSCHALPILFHGLLYLSQARQPLDSLVNTQASQWSTTTRTQETTYRDSRPRVGTGTRGRSKVESGQGHRAPRGRPRLSVRRPPCGLERWQNYTMTAVFVIHCFICPPVSHTCLHLPHLCVYLNISVGPLVFAHVEDIHFSTVVHVLGCASLYDCTYICLHCPF